jgi:hypothetical protein
MAVVSVASMTIKPDRFQDYLDTIARPSKALIEKHGGKNVRLLAGLVAGEATGSLTFVFETDDWSAFGDFGQKFFSDPEGLALVSTTNTGAGAIASLQSTVWVDVPL